MISDQLRERDCTVVNAHGDADVDIVKTAVETPLQHTTTLIGEETGLLVLLLYYAKGEVINSDQTSPKRMDLLTCITSIVFKMYSGMKCAPS